MEGLCRLEMCSHVKDRILPTSRIESLLNLTPLHTFVSKNVVSVSERISAVNLIVGWKLFAFRRNSPFLLVSHADMMSLINLFQKIGLMLLCPSISFSI